MYRGGDIRLSSSDWVLEHAHEHGALGNLYPNYNGGDIWSARLGPVRGIKEGDSPSFLSLIPNGLSDPEHPWAGSWGGRFKGNGHQLTDVPDTDLDTTADPDPRMSSVYRWRPAFQADFQARLDWCVQPATGANHPPEVRIHGDRVRSIARGASIELDASGSSDPDGDSLVLEWILYPSLDDLGSGAVVRLEGQNTSQARVIVEQGTAGQTVPVLVAVTDQGRPALTRYGRVWIELKEEE
jgi:hypothetical protein